MKLVVGLGNPGKEYENTRHNVGFMAIDHYLLNIKYKKKNNGYYYYDNKTDTIYLKPLSYMNESGSVVKKYCDYFKIKIEDVLIIYDDMAFPLGNLKIKPSGSSGGHNGMKNIIDQLKSENIKRIRIGISKTEYDKVKYVLGHFTQEEKKVLNESLEKVNEILDEYHMIDFQQLMNKYN